MIDKTKTSEEFQEISLYALLRDEYLLAKLENYIDEEFFTSMEYKIIYRNLLSYNKKYNKLPTKQELLISIEDLSKVSKEGLDVTNTIEDLYNEKGYSEVFIYDAIRRFIKRSSTELALKRLLPQLTNSDSTLSIDDVGEELTKSFGLELGKSTAFTLSEVVKLKDVRVDAVGSSENPTIIKSNIDGINKSLQFGGYKQGDLAMICSPPGCFVYDTNIRFPDGSVKSIGEMYDESMTNFPVSNIDPDTHELYADLADSIYLSRYEDVFIKLTINSTEIYCTTDHPFLTKDYKYVDAQFLSKGDILVGNVLTDDKACYYEIEDKQEVLLENQPVYGIVDSGKFHNYTLDIGDDRGIFVSNTGKTMFMVNEGAAASLQGFQVLHLFLGDMKEYDGFIRYTSRYLKIPQDTIVAMSLESQIEIINKNNFQKYFSNITVSAHGAGELTIDQMVQEVANLQEKRGVHFDLILVDYADNLAPESDMMYESGGVIYNKLSFLAFKNKSVVIVGSQPKTTYWGEEIIPKEGAAESSKKQHVIDIMMTLGKPTDDVSDPSGSKVATLFLPKVRRGKESVNRVRLNYVNASIDQISEDEYYRSRDNYTN